MIGRVLSNRYEILEEVGSGGFGTVYLAGEVGVPGRYWALKSLSALDTDPLEARRLSELFDREQKILSWLSHPSIVGRREVLTEGATVFLVMEYVDGDDLRHIVSRSKHGLSPKVVLHVAQQVCDILSYLHAQKPHPIVYRDLKPSNLMLTRQGQVKLVDFGIARLARLGEGTPQEGAQSPEPGPRKGSEDPTDVLGPNDVTEMQLDSSSIRLAQRLFTQNQPAAGDTTCMGTPGYAAPEQYAGSGMRTDARADLYSLGVIIFQLTTGEDPSKLPIPLRGMRGYVSCDELLENVVLKATAVHREQRYASAQAMGKALATCQARIPGGPQNMTGELARLLGRSRLPTPQASTPVPKKLAPAGPVTARVSSSLPSKAPVSIPKRRTLPYPDKESVLMLKRVLLGALICVPLCKALTLAWYARPEFRILRDCSLQSRRGRVTLRETGEIVFSQFADAQIQGHLTPDQARVYLSRLARGHDWLSWHTTKYVSSENRSDTCFVGLRVGDEASQDLYVDGEALRSSGQFELWRTILREANLPDVLP